MIKSFTIAMLLIAGIAQSTHAQVSGSNQHPHTAAVVVTDEHFAQVADVQVPAFWVAHQWKDVPRFGEMPSEAQGLKNTFEKGIAAVPEPGTLTLMALGVMALVLRRRVGRSGR